MYAVVFHLWKGILHTMPQLFFLIHNEFRGTSLYATQLEIFYNILFTLLPVLWA